MHNTSVKALSFALVASLVFPVISAEAQDGEKLGQCLIKNSNPRDHKAMTDLIVAALVEAPVDELQSAKDAFENSIVGLAVRECGFSMNDIRDQQDTFAKASHAYGSFIGRKVITEAFTRLQ